jgi:DNA-directed RNA polymerase specialized sigma24 family protein
MSIFFYDRRSSGTSGIMKPADAAPLVRRWYEQHGRSVDMTLARCGVSTAADRADVKQDVFSTAFVTLLRGDAIHNPAAWLTGCARKKASNYHRRQIRQAPVEAGEAVSAMASPAQLAEDREALFLVFECLDQESQDIVLAVRGEGLSWDDIASERGITVARAKYVYTVAVTLMDEALKREDERTNKRRSIVFPLLLKQVFDAIRDDVDSASPDLDRRVREGLDRFMEAAGAGAPDPEGDRVSVARPTPISIQITTPPAPSITVGPVLGILGGGIVIGIVLGYLLHNTAPDKPLPEPSRARSIPVFAMVESAETMSDVPPVNPLIRASESRAYPGEPLAQSSQGIKSDAVADPLSVAPSSESLMLIDNARAAFRAGNARAALALLAQHARSFPGKRDEKDRQKLLKLVCAAAAVRGAAECVGVASSSAPK